MKARQKIVVLREVLLVEIERRCRADACRAKNRVGLTKTEAALYHGFKCEKCEAWNQDFLAERDAPDWWEELTVTGLYGLRPPPADQDGGSAKEAESDEAIKRLSESYRAIRVE